MTITFNQIPAARKTPGIIQFLDWLIDPLSYMEKMKHNLGETFIAQFIGCPPQLYTSNPQLIKEIFALGYDRVDVGINNRSIRSLLGNYSLLTLDSSEHKHHRQLLMPPFHAQQVSHYIALIAQVTQENIEQCPISQELSIYQIVKEITLEVICQILFGASQKADYQQIKQIVRDLSDRVASPFAYLTLLIRQLQLDWGEWSFWGKIKRERDLLCQLLQSEIERRRSYLENQDLISLLFQIQSDKGESLTDRELQDELLTLLFSGQESTTAALSWSLYLVLQQEQVKSKLLAELADVDANDPLQFLQLPYLDAVVCETLRIYPPAPICQPRKTKEEMNLMGFCIPVGTLLIPCIYLTHYREDLYPEPQLFNPERFLQRHYSREEYLPFGGGNRLCLGYSLAKTEIKLILGLILKQVELQLVKDFPCKPERRSIILAPSKKLSIKVQKIITH
jgi:cytochrome P450